MLVGPKSKSKAAAKPGLSRYNTHRTAALQKEPAAAPEKEGTLSTVSTDTDSDNQDRVDKSSNYQRSKIQYGEQEHESEEDNNESHKGENDNDKSDNDYTNNETEYDELQDDLDDLLREITGFVLRAAEPKSHHPHYVACHRQLYGRAGAITKRLPRHIQVYVAVQTV